MLGDIEPTDGFVPSYWGVHSGDEALAAAFLPSLRIGERLQVEASAISEEILVNAAEFLRRHFIGRQEDGLESPDHAFTICQLHTNGFSDIIGCFSEGTRTFAISPLLLATDQTHGKCHAEQERHHRRKPG